MHFLFAQRRRLQSCFGRADHHDSLQLPFPPSRTVFRDGLEGLGFNRGCPTSPRHRESLRKRRVLQGLQSQPFQTIYPIGVKNKIVGLRSCSNQVTSEAEMSAFRQKLDKLEASQPGGKFPPQVNNLHFQHR